MDDYSEGSEPKKPLVIRAYSVSGSPLKKEIEPSYSPNQPMSFSETPIEVRKITESGTKKD